MVHIYDICAYMRPLIDTNQRRQSGKVQIATSLGVNEHASEQYSDPRNLLGLILPLIHCKL